MTVKDKIVFGILIIVVLGGGYFQYMSSEMIKRMDELNRNDKDHVDVVQNEFREELRTLDLQFIGRGKHLQKAKQGIKENTKLVYATAESLSYKIDELQINIDELNREISKRLNDVEIDVTDLEDDLLQQRRKTTQSLSEIQQKLTLLETELNTISDEVFPEQKK